MEPRLTARARGEGEGARAANGARQLPPAGARMRRGGAGVVLPALLLIPVEVASGLWRYSNKVDGQIAMNTRSTLYLDYEGDSLIQWIVPKPCTVSSLMSPSVALNCPMRGKYKIYPQVSNQTIEDAPRIFNLGAALFNFIWYMARVPESSEFYDNEEDHPDVYENFVQKDVLRIWILDPEKASSAELNNKAEVPSLLSHVLTKEFYNLGQQLMLDWYPTKHYYETYFNVEDGYWTAIIYNVTTEVILKIYGKPITFQNLFVKDTLYTIEKRLDLSVIKALGFHSLKLAQYSNPLIVYHACSSSSGLLMTDFGTFISHDGFITVEELKIVPTEMYHKEQSKAQIAAFLDRSILFLIGKSLYIRNTKGFYAKLGAEDHLPEDNINGLVSRISCASSYPLKGGRTLSSAATWTNSSLYLLSSQESKNAIHIRIPNWPSAILNLKRDSVRISTVSYGSRPPEIGVLLEGMDVHDKRKLFLSIYNEETGTWVLSSLFFHVSSNDLPAGPLHMQFINSALPAVFIWNNNSVHYSLRNNTLYGKLHVNGNEDLSKEMEGSSIHQTVFDHKLNILIKMVNNLMLFGVVGSSKLIKLHVWERKDSNIVLHSNLLSKIFIIKLVNPAVQERIYPLQMEAFSSLSMMEAPACPFQRFYHNLNHPLYYVDMGETVFFVAEIIYLEESGLHIDLVEFNMDLLRSTIKSSYKINASFHTKSLKIGLSHQKDYKYSMNYSADLEATSGVLSLEFQVNYVENTCAFSTKRVAHVSVGCPLNKHICVVRPKLSECTFKNKTKITIPRLVLSRPSEKDLEFTYHNKIFGCPIRVHYLSPFKPTLDIYVGLQYKGTMNANFIMWEENGRTDFYYNTTMEQVGCLREAQTWKAMLEHYHGDMKDRSKVWGPENYRSCFETPGLIRDMDRPYEIFNSTNKVFITWPTDHTGFYIFNVKVVDPNFSFCELTTKFAVETYGVLVRKEGTVVVSLVWTFIFILLCSFGYSYYKYISIFREILYSNKNQRYS
ncbi:cation channel sperm-associated auxiliary subunit epsilon-like [Narcine bancroftii]|uniref:cation channel sperm-associated auxiliary subunit epsilon-like n=1 Tax=Narcine bancroftii TaxID=1343680 RepID=UPI003831B5EB